MHTIHKQTAQEVFSFAQTRFFAQAQRAQKKNEFFNVALSGGSTAKGLFGALAQGDRTILQKTRWFFSDERAVSMKHQESNAGQAWRMLAEPSMIDRHHFFPMYEDGDAHQAARSYEQLIRKLVPLHHEVPVFDIIYLGMGLDGHTASLFPMSPLLHDADGLIESTEMAHAGFQRITMMPSLIHVAKEICILTTGQEKAALIKQLIHGPKDPNRWPIQLFTDSDKVYFLSSTES